MFAKEKENISFEFASAKIKIESIKEIIQKTISLLYSNFIGFYICGL